MGIKSRDCDVLIVGGGLTGLNAAITITEKAPNKKVILADLGGGASSEVMGFCAPMDAQDSPECFEEDTLRAGAGENDPALVHRLCFDATSIAKSVEAAGVKFDRKPDGTYNMLRSLGSTYHRVVHYKTLTGETAIEIYKERLSKCPQVEFVKARVAKLFLEDGKIAGALAFENGEAVAYNTPCVILSTGGAAGLYGFSSWTKMLQGSGYALAVDAGAELTGMKRVQFEPCVSVYPEKFRGFPIITTMLFEGAKLIDVKGRNVIPEGAAIPAKRALAEMIAAAVADGGDCGHGGVNFDFSGVDENLFIEKYPEYHKKLRPISEDYSQLRVEVKPAAHTTLGGVKIAPDASTKICGLYAAGEACGGIHGRDRIGGNAGLEIFVFGRAAGESASAFVGANTNIQKRCEEFISLIPTGDSHAHTTLVALGELLDNNLGVYRTDDGIEKCRAGIAELRANLKANPTNLEDYFIASNALLAAEQLCCK